MAIFGFQKNFFALFVLIGCLFVSVNSVSGGSSDKYEPDNTIETANEILLNPMLPEKLLPPGYEWEQIHNFYAPNDEDWVKFYTTKGNYYRISVTSPGKNCDPVIEIYDGNKNRVILTDDYGLAHEEYAEFISESDSMYYAGIRQCDIKDSACHASYGDNTEYHLTLIMPYINFSGSIEGYVSPIVAATVTIGPVTIPTRASDGYYLAFVPAGDLTLTVTADGYKPYSEAINIQECVESCEPLRKDIRLEKSPVNSFFPTIGSVSPAQTLSDTNSALICADNVTDTDGIKKVWAIITPPNYISYSADTPVVSLPTLELMSVGNNRYEATYDRFIAKGTYKIVIFATDNKDFTSLPEEKHITSVTQTQGNSCVFVDNDLALNICAEYQGVRYGFTMKFDDDAQLSWKMDVSTFRELQYDPGNCISVGDDLKLDMCAEYQGKDYGFEMNYDNDLIWKMDLGAFREIQ